MTPSNEGCRGVRRSAEKQLVRPVGIFVGIVVVGLALIAAALRLTAHSASASLTPLSRAQFVRTANRICLGSNRQGKALSKKPANLKAAARQVGSAVRLFDGEVAALRALVPPSRDAATYRRLLNDLGPEGREMHAILHAFETRQWGRGVVIARQLDRLSKRINKRDDPALRKLGLTFCAKD